MKLITTIEKPKPLFLFLGLHLHHSSLRTYYIYIYKTSTSTSASTTDLSASFFTEDINHKLGPGMNHQSTAWNCIGIDGQFHSGRIFSPHYYTETEEKKIFYTQTNNYI